MEKKLTRDIQDKMVAGVAAGLAKYFQLEVTWVRIAFVLAAFFGGGGLWIYIILWIAVPQEIRNPFTYTDYTVDPGKAPSDNFGSTFKSKRNNSISAIAGMGLIAVGTYFLLYEFGIIPYWFNLGKLWPLIFVVIGLSILFKGKKEAESKDFDAKDFKQKSEESAPKEEKESNDHQEDKND
jgi:phage shock protein C